jgi:curved DNA-binding protein CbpA
MPLRPPIFLQRPIACRPWICHSCRERTFFTPRRIQVSQFHRTAPRSSDSAPNHYETLQLTSTASAAEIKRQFYSLSKQHHPDRNPDDPTASTRFVEVSEAYHVLSVPEKRAQYDAQLQHSHSRGWGRGGHGSHPQGSYSSASFGSRPASGLNKKRSTFRGPPPSFYKSGGYGSHGAKRAEYAHHDPNPDAAEGAKEAGPESYGEWGGFGPGQQKHGNQVPHFDERRHKETHDNVYEHIWARRRKTQRRVHLEEEYARENFLLNFVVVSGIIAMIGATVKIFGDRSEARDNARRKEDG